MKIKEIMHQKVAELELHGKLMGPPETRNLTASVTDLLEDGVSRIVLNMKDVNWINSLGLGAIVSCIKTIQNGQGQIFVSGLTQKVRSLFMMSQLIQVVSVRDTASEAVQELNAI